MNDDDDEVSWGWEIGSRLIWLLPIGVIAWSVWLLLHP